MNLIQVELEKALTVPGWMHPDEMAWLALEAQKHNLIVEFGSLYGRSTRAICDNTEGKVWAVDLWNNQGQNPDGTYFERFEGSLLNLFNQNLDEHLGSQKLITFQGSTLEFLFHNYNNPQGLIGKVDWVFIDAGHLYEEVKNDIEIARKLLKPGGIISGHDYGEGAWGGVKQAVDELIGTVEVSGTIWYAKS